MIARFGQQVMSRSGAPPTANPLRTRVQLKPGFGAGLGPPGMRLPQGAAFAVRSAIPIGHLSPHPAQAGAFLTEGHWDDIRLGASLSFMAVVATQPTWALPFTVPICDIKFQVPTAPNNTHMHTKLALQIPQQGLRAAILSCSFSLLPPATWTHFCRASSACRS